MNAQELQVFCADDEDTKYAIGKPHIYIHPETGKPYSYATDGLRIVVVSGRVEGLSESDKPNISQFILEPRGIPVNCADLKKFMECDKPTTRKCTLCGGTGTIENECNCQFCHGDKRMECSCEGKPERIVNYGWIGNVAFNRALVADALKDIADETVLVHIAGIAEVFYIFASDRWIGCMPMRKDCEGFKDAPRFALQKAKVTR